MSPTKKKDGFTAEEKAAMRARAKELKAAAEGESAVQAALAEMSPHDRALGKRIHAIVKESAPELTPKTWYGMPAYANKDGKVVVLLPQRGEVQGAVRDARLQRQREPRRRLDVADRLRARRS